MTETRRKLKEAEYFFRLTHELFNRQSLDFQFHLNAFVNAARNVTFVMRKEFDKAPDFEEWWKNHPLKRKDSSLKKFIELRNVSVKEKSVRYNLFTIKHDFGPKGLHVVGKKGPTSVVSDPLRFDRPIPTHSYVTVKDDNGERRVKVKIVHDFSIVERYDHSTKHLKFDSFIQETAEYLQKLEALVEECESMFSASGSS